MRFTEVWNLNCAPLPTMRKAPVRRDPLSLVAGCMAGFDDDEGALAAAIRRAALEPFYREHAYGFETFCRKADRFTADPVTPVERREPELREWTPPTPEGPTGPETLAAGIALVREKLGVAP